MSQCSREMSMPKAVMARTAAAEVICSRCGAIASRVRPSLSSFRLAGAMPRISSTARARARSCTCTSGAGEVSRLQIIAWTTCPAVTVARSRIGAASSTTSAMPSCRQNEATTGRDPSILICRPASSA
jgi:hypothetical protein